MTRALAAVLLLATGPAFAQAIPDWSTGPMPGLAVDSSGGPVVDPTKNVLDLVRAESKYQDALRLAEVRRINDLFELRDRLAAAEQRRTDDLRSAAVLRSNDLRDASERLNTLSHDSLLSLADLHDENDKVLMEAATERSRDLAIRVEQTATAATTNLNRMEERLTALMNTQSARITALEQAAAVGAGRATVADPQLAGLLQTVAELRLALTASAGQAEGMSATVAFIFAAIAAIAAAVGIGIALIGRRHDPEPRIVYVPSAAGMPPVVTTPKST